MVATSSPLDMQPVEVETDTIRKLRPAAAQRQTTVPRLIRDLLSSIAENDLATAVLDDGEDFVK
jgi:hypothetical protein